MDEVMASPEAVDARGVATSASPEPVAEPRGAAGRGPSLPLSSRFLLLATGLIGIPLALAIGITT